ncbi:MAG: non-heme iron oxygenase ferredoxin subunit [Planctomycetales bacterium]|nr:non-heme iron oxygenase ferredoxin subunit [Planctomycetales bacterium]
MSEFQRVAAVADVPDPGKVTVDVDDRLVVLIHAGGDWYCIDDVCTHDGGPLGEGPLDNGAIVCPRHGARFAIATGAALTMPATEPTLVHEVKVEQGEVFVRLKAE